MQRDNPTKKLYEMAEPKVEIYEQPTQRMFRSKGEIQAGGSTPITGHQSTEQSISDPKIKILNYCGPVTVVVSCVTNASPHKPHPHNLVGKNCQDGVCINSAGAYDTDIISFPGLNIQFTEKKDFKKSLDLRKSLDVEPFKTGFELDKSVKMNAVRLCFQVYLPHDSEVTKYLPPVVSEPIFTNTKGQHKKRIENLCNRYGRIVANYPWWFIIVPVIICGLFGMGLLKLTSESELETLYVPMNSQSEADRSTVENLFPDKSDTNYFVLSLARPNMYGDIIFISKNGSNVLRSDVLDEISEVVSELAEFTIENKETVVNYSQVCAVLGGQCFITGQYILNTSFLTLFESGNITYPDWTDSNGNSIDLSRTLNGVSENGKLQSVTTIKITFNLRQTDPALSANWEDRFVTEMSKIKTNVTDFVYSTSTSLDKELSANTGQDITWISISFALLMTYASFVASSGNCVANRSVLALAGVFGIPFAILAAFGLCSTMVKFVDIVGVMPFLALGVGIDSMFVIMSEWAEHYDEPTNEHQIGTTIAKCAGSITIASLTNITAFLIGVSSNFISIRNFCVFTAVALFFSFILHFTFFLGCLTLHGRRVRDNKQCFNCKKVGDDSKYKDKWKSPSKREDDESFCEKFAQLPVRITYSDSFIMVVKIVIIFLFLGYLGASIWGVYNLRQGLILSNLVNENSYFHSYETLSRMNYKSVLPISVIFQDVDYLDPDQVSAMEKVLNDIQDDSKIAKDSLVCWFNVVKNIPGFDASTDRNKFMTQLRDFLSQTSMFSNDVIFTSDGSDILASRCHFITENIPDSTDRGNLMLRLREITEKSDLNVFPYSASFIFFEQYVAILPSTLQTMGIAVACMFVITIIFMPHPVMVILVTLNMLCILVGILGFLYYWDLSLSSITMIHLIMSVGFSVDFSVHVCHGFISSESETRHGRTKDALRVSASPILNGGISSLLGILALVFSQSYVFRSFFKIMVLVITFGLAHSLLLLPAVLSICGPKKTPRNRVSTIKHITVAEVSNT